jgi:hypothetical protein
MRSLRKDYNGVDEKTSTPEWATTAPIAWRLTSLHVPSVTTCWQRSGLRAYFFANPLSEITSYPVRERLLVLVLALVPVTIVEGLVRR